MLTLTRDRLNYTIGTAPVFQNHIIVYVRRTARIVWIVELGASI